MFSFKPGHEQQLDAKITQLSEGALLLPQLIVAEPVRGLLAVSDHVQQCTPAVLTAAKATMEQGQRAQLLAEELEEVAAAMQEHADTCGPHVQRALQRMGLGTGMAGAGAAPSQSDAARGSASSKPN